MALFSYQFIGPVIEGANNVVTSLIEALVSTGFLPLLSIINEPAKVLFLNNVIDQGIYYPLGMQAAVDTGKSIYFMVASLILKFQNKTADDEKMAESIEKSKEMKRQGKSVLNAKIGKTSEINHIAFACDAGLGSSALGANAFKKKLSKVGIDKKVKNYAIENVPEDADVIITHVNLEDRARLKFKDKRIYCH
jgi:mannitol-specific phosphotransferase system IIBC component